MSNQFQGEIIVNLMQDELNAILSAKERFGVAVKWRSEISDARNLKLEVFLMNFI